MSEERAAHLEALGFDWDPRGTQWEERLGELKAYKAAHGDCLVPWEYPDNPQLRYWVVNQRHRYHRREISADRAARLEALGFDWNPLGAK
mmetsp:Transcript_4283/g.12076  ORF Transcript_4283/g.12076 Transcript_4283/m.12076 type:complete len:90 (+) Transcript_4283:184-453(+)